MSVRLSEVLLLVGGSALAPFLSGGCSGLARQQFYELDAERGQAHPRRGWAPSGPDFSLDSDSGETHVHVHVTNHAMRTVIAGPLILWVIPVYAVNWIWAEPLQENPLTIQVSIRASTPRLEVHPERMALLANDGGGALAFSSTQEALRSRDICHGQEERDVAGPLPVEERDSVFVVLTCDATARAELLLALGGIFVDGKEEVFPAITVRKASGWTTWAEPH